VTLRKADSRFKQTVIPGVDPESRTARHDVAEGEEGLAAPKL